MIQGRAQGLSKHRPLPKLILIVEDDAVNADCLANIIWRETAYSAFVVTDSSRALQFVRHIKPQLFILDYRLPDMNALELYDRLHANKDLLDIPALILSACVEYYQGDIKARKLHSLGKPFDLDELLSTIESLLDSSPVSKHSSSDPE